MQKIDGMKYLNVQDTDSTLTTILDELTATQTTEVGLLVKAFQLFALCCGGQNRPRLITISIAGNTDYDRRRF